MTAISFFVEGTMSEKAENLLNNLVETLAESTTKQKSASFFGEEKSKSVSSQFNRLFGRQKPVHHLLGGGKCRNIFYFLLPWQSILLSLTSFFFLPLLLLNHVAADVLLWRNKKISASVLTSATIIWVVFEWLNYNLLTIVGFILVLGMLAQFVWSNASGMLNR